MDLNIGPTWGYYVIYLANSAVMSAVYIWVCKQLISPRCLTWHKLTGSLFGSGSVYGDLNVIEFK